MSCVYVVPFALKYKMDRVRLLFFFFFFFSFFLVRVLLFLIVYLEFEIEVQVLECSEYQNFAITMTSTKSKTSGQHSCQVPKTRKQIPVQFCQSCFL